ncbi:hypothetical protein [Azospirillum sp. Sh1]|uniref:GT-D fold domain-containing protein n=1 Tax=Azospirillum sp. Sh1 TaxID=2607285 RepID=UPI001B3BDAE2|nr:hypothetical protein [Azospirillum sp. Sh1]
MGGPLCIGALAVMCPSPQGIGNAARPLGELGIRPRPMARAGSAWSVGPGPSGRSLATPRPLCYNAPLPDKPRRVGGMQRYLKYPDVADALHSAISEKRPFSLIRLGDGEARIMGYPVHTNWLSVSEMMKVWFGHPFFPDAAVQQIQADLRMACLTADILGLPNPDTVTDADRTDPFKAAALYVREFGYLADGTALTSPGIHTNLEREGLYDTLLGGLDEVVLITSRDVAGIVADRFGIAKVTPFLIPPEMHYSDLPQAEKLEQSLLNPHFPTRYLEVGAFISDHVRRRPGVPVLVGAGILGKVYCCWAKSVGAVAIDIGSVFDLWAGLRTRANPLFRSGRLVQDATGRPPWLADTESDGSSSPPPDGPMREVCGTIDKGRSVLVFDGVVDLSRIAKPLQLRCSVGGVLIGAHLTGDPIEVARVDPPAAGAALPVQCRFRAAFAVGDGAMDGHGVMLEALDREGGWMTVEVVGPNPVFSSLICVRHRLVRFAVPSDSMTGQGPLHVVLRLPTRIPAGYRNDEALSPLPLEDADALADGAMRIRLGIDRCLLRDGRAGLLLPASSAEGALLEFQATMPADR